VREELTLSDGTVLPKNVHLMMPIYSIVVDSVNVPDPMTFDGFRHYNNRQKPGELNRHQFATTSNTNLHFGHGKFSCPGRFFAANSIKIVIANLLMEYDFKFDDVANHGPKRPDNIRLHEYVFPNPDAKVMFKLREKLSMI
jgi:cytochrome P450